MSNDGSIFFQESGRSPADLLTGTGGRPPETSRSGPRSEALARSLRREQARRLEKNISYLRRKQEEFNRKIEEYVESLHKLAATLDAACSSEGDSKDGDDAANGARVQCLTCGGERVFGAVRILAACAAGGQSLAEPTELVIEDGGKLKRGWFRCPRCGDSSLVVRDAGSQKAADPIT